jgi:release factor glutamine methyltransferase
MRLLTLPGVFHPHSDTWMLADAIACDPGLRGSEVLDVCTGSGALALTAAGGGARATAVDVSRRSVATVRINARLNRVHVEALRGDLFGPVEGRRFDLIVSNPPYLPGDAELPARGASRAWEGGATGRVLVDRIVAGASAHLRPGGRLLMVHSSVTGLSRTLEALSARGLETEVVERRSGAFGGLLAARAADLERAGVIEPGQREEELAVLAGHAPG